LRQAVFGEVIDDAVEQFLPTLEIGCPRHGRNTTPDTRGGYC
jgi:hypothetical protein